MTSTTAGDEAEKNTVSSSAVSMGGCVSWTLDPVDVEPALTGGGAELTAAAGLAGVCDCFVNRASMMSADFILAFSPAALASACSSDRDFFESVSLSMISAGEDKNSGTVEHLDPVPGTKYCNDFLTATMSQTNAKN